MRAYLIKRLLAMVVTLLGITMVTFLIIQLAPGNPAEMKIRQIKSGDVDPQYTAEIIEQTKKLYGLDKPLPIQYLMWLKRIVRFDTETMRPVFFDFGESFKDHRPVRDKIFERVPVSIQLSLISILLVYLIAVPIGVFSSVKQDTWPDKIVTVGLFILYSLPHFWVAMLLITLAGGSLESDNFVFSGILHVFGKLPIFGISSDGAENLSALAWLEDRALHLVLPVTCLTYGGLAYISRQMRGSMLEVIRQDYVRTARAKGLSEKVVVFKHAFRNSLIPIVTLMAALFPAMIGGSVIIETIFSIPGMGQLSFEAILSRDYPTIMGVTTMAGFLTLLGILAADLTYILIDPAISFESSGAALGKRALAFALAAIGLLAIVGLATPKLGISPGTLLVVHGPKIGMAILAMSVLYIAYVLAGEREYWLGVLRQFKKNRLAFAALCLLGLLFIVAVMAPLLANDKPLMMTYRDKTYFPALRDYLPEGMRVYKEFGPGGAAEAAKDLGPGDSAHFSPVGWGPYQIDHGHFLEDPSGRHLLGTDDVGRDVLARIIHGARIALSIGFVAVGIYVWIGIVMGALAGYYGGWVDIAISRLIEIVLSIPTFFLILSVIAFLEPSIYNVMAAIGLVGWTGTARLVRAEFLKLRERQFVEASKALGARDPRVIFRHILPNALTPVLVVATFGVADAILVESSLSFLGFGVQPPTASWGDILSKAQRYYEYAWWITLFPGVAIFFTVTVLNLVGEGLRDAIDPRLKGNR